MDDEIETPIPGERSEIPASGRTDRNPLARRGAIVLAVVAFIGFAVWSMRGHAPQINADSSEDVVIRQMTDFEPAAKKKDPPPAPVPRIQLPVPATTPEYRSDDAELLDSARRAPVMAFGGESSGAAVENNKPATANASPYLPLNGLRGRGDTGESGIEAFEQRLTPTRLEGSRAGRLGNRDFIIAMGTMIPCVLETAMASDQPGFVRCVVSRDILSDNGRVVLMEKGTEIVGEYRGGLRRGQRRLFILWDRAKTPTGVIITLASPATDELGRAGVGGYVDTHWWERFGSALLLSIVGDAASYAGSALQDHDIQARGTTSAGKNAAAIAVEQSIDIPPTLEKHQGDVVSVFVARDLDFSGVYGLRLIEPMNRIYDRAVLGDFSRQPAFVTK